MEQLKMQMAEQRTHNKDLETQLEKQRCDAEAERKELEAKLEAQRQSYEAKLEAQRKDRSRETEAQARMLKVTVLRVRLEAMYDARLLEDDELAAIEDKVADAIGVATGDGGEWVCVMQMIQLSEGITSEKMFARQLRRKFV